MAQEPLKVIVVGAAGRMGLRIAAMIQENPGFLLAGAVERKDHPRIGGDIGEMAGTGQNHVLLSGELSDVISRGDVIIDFTTAETSMKVLPLAAKSGKSAVIGSTGFTAAQMQEIRKLAQKIPCVVSPNMSVGVNVMFRVIGDLAKILGDDYDLEVVEAHHRSSREELLEGLNFLKKEAMV